MSRPPNKLREDALRIWRAGLEAVRSPRLLFDAVEVVGPAIRIGEELVELNSIGRIGVVGGGKAAAGMARALEQALGPNVLRVKNVAGLVIAPSDHLVATDRIALHTGRPAGVNEPTAAGESAVREMLHFVEELSPRDLCIGLVSGGGSALMPAPIDGFSLHDKVALTRELSARGATIEQINAVRRELSAIKGGGLARACRAGRLATLILSDVSGDDLSVIASGPTVLCMPSPQEALSVLQSFDLVEHPSGRPAAELLSRRLHSEKFSSAVRYSPKSSVTSHGCLVTNLLIGNNAVAVDAAGGEAERLGYSHAMVSADGPEGLAEEVARRLVEMADRMRREAGGPDCLIAGGEPTVKLAPEGVRGRGGRNQQLCLAALAELRDWRNLALISGGTDGEDGPTDAAGACVDEQVANEAQRLGLDPGEYLARNDAYSFFAATGGLLKTEPTHTNVCDLRVLTVSR